MKPARMLLVATLAMATAGLVAASAARQQTEPAQAGSQAVQLLSAADIRAARVLPADDRGPTYYWLEGLAHKVTVQFPDAVAVSERGADGVLTTRLTDRLHNDLATFRVNRIAEGADVLDYQAGAQAPMLAARRADVHATLAWSGRQAYRLWKDAHGAEPASLEWRDGFMRARGAARHGRDDETEQITTEWPDGITAVVTRQDGPRRNVLTGERLQKAHAIVSRFHQNGVTIGVVAWYPEEQVVEWNFPNVSKGYVDPTRLKKAGGWQFTPDMAWASVQGFAFKHFADEIAAKGFVAQRQAEPAPGLAGRVAAFFAPTLLANEPGCDDLHWFDHSIFRACCDMHDQCYEKEGCTAGSWWTFGAKWSCVRCNMTVIVCFFSGGDTPWGPRYI
jgi:hypothetical protein